MSSSEAGALVTTFLLLSSETPSSYGFQEARRGNAPKNPSRNWTVFESPGNTGGIWASN
jgi:hypothetical protein